MSKQKTVYTLTEEVKHSWSNWTREPCRWMSTYSLQVCLLMLLRVTLSFLPTLRHRIYLIMLPTALQIILDDLWSPKKFWMLISILCQDGNKPHSLDSSWNCSQWIKWTMVTAQVFTWFSLHFDINISLHYPLHNIISLVYWLVQQLTNSLLCVHKYTNR